MADFEMALLRPLGREDVPALVELEREIFPVPWEHQVFYEELDRNIAGLVGIFAAPARIVAYLNYWLVAGEFHILRVATLPDLRRQGLAERLMRHAIDTARAADCADIHLEVRRSNGAALSLYRKFGFATVGVRSGYYPDDGEDAVTMTLHL